MKTNTTKPTTVSEYIKDASPEARKKLREMRACVRAVAPGAKEELKWGMPALSYRRILVIYAGKGSIQFPLDQPLPLALIRQIAAFRVRESKREDKKWRA